MKVQTSLNFGRVESNHIPAIQCNCTGITFRCVYLVACLAAINSVLFHVCSLLCDMSSIAIEQVKCDFICHLPVFFSVVRYIWASSERSAIVKLFGFFSPENDSCTQYTINDDDAILTSSFGSWYYIECG